MKNPPATQVFTKTELELNLELQKTEEKMTEIFLIEIIRSQSTSILLKVHCNQSAMLFYQLGLFNTPKPDIALLLSEDKHKQYKEQSNTVHLFYEQFGRVFTQNDQLSSDLQNLSAFIHIKNLWPGQAYTIHVAAINSKGTVSEIFSFDFSTLDPSPPVSFSLSFLAEIDLNKIQNVIQEISGLESERLLIESKGNSYEKVPETSQEIDSNKEYYHYNTEQFLEMMVQTQTLNDGLLVPEFSQKLFESEYFSIISQDNSKISKDDLILADPTLPLGDRIYDMIPGLSTSSIYSYQIHILPDFIDDGPSPWSSAQLITSKNIYLKQKFPSFIDLQDPSDTIRESEIPSQSFHMEPNVSEISAFFAVFKFGISIPGNVYGIVINRDKGTPEPFQVRLGVDPSNYILRDGHRLALEVQEDKLLDSTYQRFNFTLLEHSTRYSAFFVASTADTLREGFQAASDGDIYQVDFMTKVEVFHISSQMEFLDIKVEQV
jgi:hypothetical protein